MTRSNTAIGVLLLCIAAVITAGTAVPAEPTPPPFDLSNTVRRLISAAASSSGFALLGRWGPRVEPHLLFTPPLPTGYIAYHVSGTREYVLADGPRNTAALVWVDESMEGLSKPLHTPAGLAADTERILSAYLDGHYSQHVLQTGMLFTSPRRPTVEFVFVRGLPAGIRTSLISFKMALIVFPPHAALLELVNPCDRWWLSTPPPGWVKRAGEDCDWRWARIASQP